MFYNIKEGSITVCSADWKVGWSFKLNLCSQLEDFNCNTESDDHILFQVL
jgi:hypothetical protein